MVAQVILRRYAVRGHRAYATAAQVLSQPVSIKPSATEILAGALNERSLETAVRHLHQDGLVVIEDAISHQHLDSLNKKMVQDARHLQSLGDKGPFNYNLGNLQQDPPPLARFFSTAIFTNPIATQVTSAVLGPRPKWTFCSGNSAMPPSTDQKPQRQPVHSDADFAHPAHPFALVVNVPLVSMDAHNGSTELWLGTHNTGIEAQEGAHGERASGRIKPSLIEQRRQVRPPSQPMMRKGSIVIRDLRLWHAGMPNRSNEVRIMLAMIHFASWYRNKMRLQLGEDVKPLLTQEDALQVPVDWQSTAEAEENYLGRSFGNSYDFGQTS